MCLAIPGRVLNVCDCDPTTRVGRVDFGGVVKEINLTFVPEAQVDDYVVVHVGCALAKIDPEEARRTLVLLDELATTPTGARP